MSRTVSVANYLADRIERSGKSQREIAREVGYPHANVITMMKQGATKVPVEKAPALARALDVDPAHLVRLVMREYHPEAWRAIEGALGHLLTRNERRLVEAYREVCIGEELALEDATFAAVRGELEKERERLRGSAGGPDA